jgi:hypothetical protein
MHGLAIAELAHRDMPGQPGEPPSTISRYMDVCGPFNRLESSK